MTNESLPPASVTGAFAKEVENLFPIPKRFGDFRSIDLLRAAGLGRIGVDQRLISALLAHGDIEESIALYMRESAQDEDLFPVPLNDLIVDLVRHLKSPQALATYIAVMKRHEGRATEALGEAIIEQGAPAIEPMLEMAVELDESQVTETARILSALRPRDERVFPILVEHFEYDTFSGALCFALHGDSRALPLLKARRNDPGVDADLRADIDRCIGELESPGEEVAPPEFKILSEYDKHSPPEVEVLSDEERLALLSDASCAEYQIAVLEDVSPDEMGSGPFAVRVRAILDDPALAPVVRGRAWECLSQELEANKKLAKRAKATLSDTAMPWPERAGALVSYASALEPDEQVRDTIRQLYDLDGYRATALKAMWRSFDRTWIDYFPKHLNDRDQEVQEQAIFGVGHFGIVSSIDKLEKLFGNEDLRAPALYAYALATPGGADRTKARATARLIDKLAGGLDDEESELVQHAIDQRLMQLGKQPVFHRGDE